MWKGPTKYSHMWFNGFQSNGHYDIAAIAKMRESPYFFSVLNSFSDIQFAFDDGVRIFILYSPDILFSMSKRNKGDDNIEQSNSFRFGSRFFFGHFLMVYLV